MWLPSKNSKYKKENKLAGFFAGFLHGMLTPVTLFIGAFNSESTIYETNNTGFTYDFGFFWGIGTLYLLSGMITFF